MSDFFQCSEAELLILQAGAAITVVVFGVMLYSIASFQQSPDSGLATFAHNKVSETIWASIAILIVIISAMPAVHTLTSNRRCDLTLVDPATGQRLFNIVPDNFVL